MFGRNNKLSQKRQRRTENHSFQKLEERNLLAAINFTPAGQLYIAGDAGHNTGALTQLNDTTFRATVDGESRDVAVSEVNEIVFLGFGGNDTFTNNTSTEVTAYGHAGNDTLRGGSGIDNLIGGSGNDTIHGNDGNDRLVGANGDDTVFGGNGNDRIFGSAGTNELSGGNGDDVIYGSDTGDDILRGGNGIDWLFGLGGDDTLYADDGGSADAGAELLMGHGGNDTFFGGAGFNIFLGGNGNDTINGGNNADNRIHGNAGDDVLIGGNRADLLRGHAGNDTLTGMGGNDVIEAGSGSGDVVTFTNTYASSTVTTSANGQNATVTSNGTDRITGAERLNFSDRQMTSNQATLAGPESESLIDLNSYRTSSARPVFTAPSDLTTFAENWSRTMSRVGLSHSSQSSRQALMVGGRSTVGENIIQIPDTGQTAAGIAAEMHNGWLNSTPHRTNMLNGNFNEVGIGIVKSGGFWWGTHVFAG